MHVACWPGASVMAPLGAQSPLMIVLNVPGLALTPTSPTECSPVEVTTGPVLSPHLMRWKTWSSRLSWKRALTPAGRQRLTIVICAVLSPWRTFVMVQVASWPAATVIEPSGAQSPPMVVV
jgi:hypothetical protein